MTDITRRKALLTVAGTLIGSISLDALGVRRRDHGKKDRTAVFKILEDLGNGIFLATTHNMRLRPYGDTAKLDYSSRTDIPKKGDHVYVTGLIKNRDGMCTLYKVTNSTPATEEQYRTINQTTTSARGR